MNDNQPHHAEPQSQPTGQPAAGELAEVTNGRVVLGERAADHLVRMTTPAAATVIDLDDDPTLAAVAHALGRTYLPVDLTTLETPPARPADVVVLRWPRPGERSWLSTAGEVFAAVDGLLAPQGRVAMVLDPTPTLAFGITWTSNLLAAATIAGLSPLQDIVCLHDLKPTDQDQPETAGPAVTLRHRVILVLGTGRARHVAP